MKNIKKLFESKKVRIAAVFMLVVAIASGLFVTAKMTGKWTVEQGITAKAGNVELDAKFVEPGKDTMSDEYKKALFENLYSGAGDPDYLENDNTKFDADIVIKDTGSLNSDFIVYLSGSFLDNYATATANEKEFYKNLRLRVKELELADGLKLTEKIVEDGITFQELYEKREEHNDLSVEGGKKLYVPICHVEAIPNKKVANTESKIRLHFSMDDIDKGKYDFKEIGDWSGTSTDDKSQGQSITFNLDVKALANPRHQEKPTGKDASSPTTTTEPTEPTDP